MYDNEIRGYNTSKGNLPDASTFIPEGDNIPLSCAYNVFRSQYDNYIVEDDYTMLKAVVKVYLTGVAYLKTHSSSEEIRTIASAAWEVINRTEVSFVSEIGDLDEYYEAEGDEVTPTGMVVVSDVEDEAREDSDLEDDYLQSFRMGAKFDAAEPESLVGNFEIKVIKENSGIMIDLSSDIFLEAIDQRNPIRMLSSIAKSCAKVVFAEGNGKRNISDEAKEQSVRSIEAHALLMFYGEVANELGIDVIEVPAILERFGEMRTDDFHYYDSLLKDFPKGADFSVISLEYFQMAIQRLKYNGIHLN